LIIFISITIALLFIFSHLFNEEREVPKASQGVLDLANWSFEKDGPVNLYGQWEFYWKDLNPNDENKPQNVINVPSQWSDKDNIENKGFATYKLTVKNLPKYLSNRKHTNSRNYYTYF
jgi:two-component system, sensor histidine kinase ChiS